MIKLVGTSHISPYSIRKIKEELDEEPDCVAVELDEGRYRAMKSGERGDYPSLFFKILSWIQKRLGEKTGVLPGEEMLSATEGAIERDIKVYLIDRPIHITVKRFEKIGLLEKIKLFLFSIGKLRGCDFDLAEVPSYKIIEESLNVMKRRAPKMYSVLVEERDKVMVEVLVSLAERHDTVLVVVGAGHIPGIKGMLQEKNVDFVDKTFK